MSESVERTITFVGAMSQTANAFNRSGKKDGGRIQLDIPESEMASFAQLMVYAPQKILKVSIDIMESDTIGRYSEDEE